MRASTLVATFVVITIFCVACAEPLPSPTPVPPTLTPSPTPEPKRLVVCLAEEPDSLYLYGPRDSAARHIWQAIYDGPLDSRAYGHQPVILTTLPNLSAGSAAVETVVVQPGERVLALSGDVVELEPGVQVRDAEGQRITFDSTPIPMLRMTVTFTLRSGLYWSDGSPLTADDSVFSFDLAADPATPVDKYTVERTAGYRAVDEHTVVWGGVPGFVDHFYYLNFWHPLPRHAWGHLSAAELLSADASVRKPIGWGPFAIREWAPGDRVTVVRNTAYFRAAEGLPRLDEVVFRFISDPATLAGELLANRCDVVPHGAADAVRAALPDPSDGLQVLSTHDSRWELLAFGISPALGYDRPDFFEDVRVRQGIAQCIDRQALAQQAALQAAQQTIGAIGRVLHSYVPPEHPLYAGETLTIWAYNPETGQKLLADAGWYDEDGDGVREAHGIPGIADGTPFQFGYQTTDDPLRIQVAQLVQNDLAVCGLRAVVEAVAPDELFAPGPEGALFGRRFDVAQFSWRAAPDPLCDLFLSGQMPDEGRWDRSNVAGFLDDEYDVACSSALGALPGSEAYVAGHRDAQGIFSKRLPVLPLFQRQRITLIRTSVVGLAPSPTQPSDLWNIEQLDVRP